MSGRRARTTDRLRLGTDATGVEDVDASARSCDDPVDDAVSGNDCDDDDACDTASVVLGSGLPLAVPVSAADESTDCDVAADSSACGAVPVVAAMPSTLGWALPLVGSSAPEPYVLTHDQAISTQQPQILGLSSPTVVRDIEDGELPSHVLVPSGEIPTFSATARNFPPHVIASSPKAVPSSAAWTMARSLPCSLASPQTLTCRTGLPDSSRVPGRRPRYPRSRAGTAARLSALIRDRRYLHAEGKVRHPFRADLCPGKRASTRRSIEAPLQPGSASRSWTDSSSGTT